MKPRKTIDADLEKKRSLFFEIGVFLSLGVVLLMMEKNFKSSEKEFFQNEVEYSSEQEMIPITRQDQPLPPPPPSPVKSYNVLNIVDDDIELDEELEILDSETSEDQEIEVVKMEEIELEEEVSDDAPVFVVVEDMPIFRPDICSNYVEGQKELLNYISKSINYPVIAQENGVVGKVYVSFVVSPKGKVTNVVVTRSVDPALDKEAIRVVSELPLFSPGKQRGKPVKVQFSVPINFVLQ